MAGRIGWFALVSGLAAQAACYLAAWLAPPGGPATLLAIYGTSASLAGVLVLGALRQGRLSTPARIAALAVFVIPVVGFGAAFLLPPETAAAPLWLGLPRRAAIVLLGVGILPVLLLPVAYLRDHEAPLDDATLTALVAEGQRLRQPSRP
jgi:hypothetical protein